MSSPACRMAAAVSFRRHPRASSSIFRAQTSGDSLRDRKLTWPGTTAASSGTRSEARTGSPRRLGLQHGDAEPLKPRRENENVHSLQQIRNIVPAAQQADASPPFRTLRLLSDLFLLFPAASRQHQKGIRVQAQERLKNAQQKLMVLGPGKVARVACHQFSLPAHFPSDPLTGFRRITEFSRINGVPDHHGILHSLAAKEPAAAPIHCT